MLPKLKDRSLILTPLGTSTCLGWFLSSLQSKISTTWNPLKSHFLGTSWYFALDLVFPWSTSQSTAHSPACTKLPVELRFINKMHTVLTLQTIDATSMIKKSALQIHQSKTQSLHWEKNSGWFTIPHGKLLQSPLITSSILLFPLMPFNNLATLYLCPAFSLNFSSCTCDSRFPSKLGCSPSPLIVTIRNSMEFHVFGSRDPWKPSCSTITGKGDNPKYKTACFSTSQHISAPNKHTNDNKSKHKNDHKNTKYKGRSGETNRICPYNCDTKDVGSGRHIQMILLILLAFLTEDQRIFLQRFLGDREMLMFRCSTWSRWQSWIMNLCASWRFCPSKLNPIVNPWWTGLPPGSLWA